MTKSRYNPKYKIKLQNQISKDITSTNLPSIYKASKTNYYQETVLLFIDNMNTIN